MRSLENIRQKLPEIKYKTRVTLRKVKYLFKHRKEVYKKIVSKLDKKAYGVSSFMAIGSGQVLPYINAGITLVAGGVLKNQESAAVGIPLLGLIAIASNLKSFQTEVKTLVEKRYSNSPVTTLLFRYLDNKNLKVFKKLEKYSNTELAAKAASLASHGYYFLILGLLNPANALAFYDFIKGDPAARLVIIGLLTVASTNAFWNIWSENRILKGDDEKVINRIKELNPLTKTLNKFDFSLDN